MTVASLAQAKQVLDLLSGRSTEEVQQLIEAGDLLGLMMGTDLSKVDRAAFAALCSPTFERLFRTPEQILAAFMEWQQGQQWFGAEHYDQLRATMPADYVSQLNGVLMLEIWCGDLSTTFEALWDWSKQVHAQTWRWDSLKSDEQHLQLLDASRYGNQPSVRWVLVDLTANRGQAPKDVRDPATSPDLAILAAAALHPDWAAAIDYDAIPAVWLPGLQATVSGGDSWRHVPILYRGGREVGLNAHWDDNRYSDYAVPVLREL